MGEKPDDERKLIARNKKARYRYHVLETWQAGIVLQGTEVKSLRAGQVALADSFARFKGGELWLMNCHIAPYDKGSHANHEPMRPRKLLLHRRELRKMKSAVDEKGLTLVPLSLYFLEGRAKVKIGLARARPVGDRRRDLEKREDEREIRRSYG